MRFNTKQVTRWMIVLAICMAIFLLGVNFMLTRRSTPPSTPIVSGPNYQTVQIGWTPQQVRQAYGNPQTQENSGEKSTWTYRTPRTQNMYLDFYEGRVALIAVAQLSEADVQNSRPLRFVTAKHPNDADNTGYLHEMQRNFDAHHPD